MTAIRTGSWTWGAASPTPAYSAIVSRMSSTSRRVAGERISDSGELPARRAQDGMSEAGDLADGHRSRATLTKRGQNRVRCEAPPSMVMMVPVVLAERSDTRKATMSPMCSGLPGG